LNGCIGSISIYVEHLLIKILALSISNFSGMKTKKLKTFLLLIQQLHLEQVYLQIGGKSTFSNLLISVKGNKVGHLKVK